MAKNPQPKRVVSNTRTITREMPEAPRPRAKSTPRPRSNSAATVASNSSPPNNGSGILIAIAVAFLGVAVLAFAGVVYNRPAPTQQATITLPPAPVVQTTPAPAPQQANLDNRPWFEVGGRQPTKETQAAAAQQGYQVKKGVPGDTACKIVDTPQGKVNRCPNSWAKR